MVGGGGGEPKYWYREAYELTSMNWKKVPTPVKKMFHQILFWGHTHTHIHRKTRKKIFFTKYYFGNIHNNKK